MAGRKGVAKREEFRNGYPLFFPVSALRNSTNFATEKRFLAGGIKRSGAGYRADGRMADEKS